MAFMCPPTHFLLNLRTLAILLALLTYLVFTSSRLITSGHLTHNTNSNSPPIFTYYSVLHQILTMGPKQRMLPRQLGEEKEQHDREQAAQNDEAIRTSIASSRASIPFNHLGNQTFQQNFQQMPDNAPEVTTTMQQPLGMTAPTGLDFEWGNFSNQGFVNQSSFATTPTLNNDSPGE